MNTSKLLLELQLLLALLLVSGIACAEAIAPDVMIKNTANEVLEILRSNKDFVNGDMNKIGLLVEDRIATKFDFNLMAKMVMGRNWSIASKDQQEQFIIEFRSFLVRIYSTALSKYRNQTIEYKPLRANPGDTEVKVNTQILQPGGPAIQLDYNLARVQGNWKVYDVIIDGLSLVAIYNGQFSEVVKRNGINGLIQKLAEKNKRPVLPANTGMSGYGVRGVC
jgi:phospholipid transport system substrate-binding protein